MTPRSRFRLRVYQSDGIAIGPGKVALLEAIAQTGSISAAARAMGMSYRRAWLLVDETNRALHGPAVSRTTGGARGGGAALTDIGRAVVAHYRAIESIAAEAAAAEILALEALCRPPGA